MLKRSTSDAKLSICQPLLLSARINYVQIYTDWRSRTKRSSISHIVCTKIFFCTQRPCVFSVLISFCLQMVISFVDLHYTQHQYNIGCRASHPAGKKIRNGCCCSNWAVFYRPVRRTPLQAIQISHLWSGPARRTWYNYYYFVPFFGLGAKMPNGKYAAIWTIRSTNDSGNSLWRIILPLFSSTCAGMVSSSQ